MKRVTLIVLAALAASPLIAHVPQPAHLALAAPESTPETVADDADFPFLARIAGTTLVKTTRVNEPLEVKPASADSEAMLAGMSFVEKSYGAPTNVWDPAFVSLYRDALVLHGWRILDQPLATGAESEPHVINLSAHYAANGRDLYARISRAPDGAYAIGVADVGAEDWGAMLDRACHVPIFSVHFKHDLTLYDDDARPTLEKLASDAAIEARDANRDSRPPGQRRRRQRTGRPVVEASVDREPVALLAWSRSRSRNRQRLRQVTADRRPTTPTGAARRIVGSR